MKKKIGEIIRILKRYQWELIIHYYHKSNDKYSLIVGKDGNRLKLTSDVDGNMISCHYITYIAK